MTDTVSKNESQLLYDPDTEMFQLKNNLSEITGSEILTITLQDLKNIGNETKSNNGSNKSNCPVINVGNHQINKNDDKNEFINNLKNGDSITGFYFVHYFQTCKKKFAFIFPKKSVKREHDGILKTTKTTTDLSKLMIEYPSMAFKKYFFLTKEDNQESISDEEAETRFFNYNRKFQEVPINSLIFLEIKCNNELINAADQLQMDFNAFTNLLTGDRKIGLIALSFDENLIFAPQTEDDEKKGKGILACLKAGFTSLKTIAETFQVDIILINVTDKFYGYNPFNKKININEIYAREKEKNEEIIKAKDEEIKAKDETIKEIIKAKDEEIKAMEEQNQKLIQRIKEMYPNFVLDKI